MLSALVSILVLSSLSQNVLSPNKPMPNALAQNAPGQNATVQSALAPNKPMPNALAQNATVQSALDTTRLPQPVFAENPGLFKPQIIWECNTPSTNKPPLDPISLFIENVLGIRSVDAEKLTVDWDIHHKCLHGVRNLRFGPVVTDLIYEKGLVKAKSNKEYTLVVSGRKYKVPAGNSTFSVINRREFMVEPYTLPDPLQGVSSPDELPSRRAEILSLFEREMSGNASLYLFP